MLELEGFIIWSSLMGADTENRRTLAQAYQTYKNLRFWGAFVDGGRDQWQDEKSELRRICDEMGRWAAPVYTLVMEGDWKIQPHVVLATQKSPLAAQEPIAGTASRS